MISTKKPYDSKLDVVDTERIKALKLESAKQQLAILEDKNNSKTTLENDIQSSKTEAETTTKKATKSRFIRGQQIFSTGNNLCINNWSSKPNYWRHCRYLKPTCRLISAHSFVLWSCGCEPFASCNHSGDIPINCWHFESSYEE